MEGAESFVGTQAVGDAVVTTATDCAPCGRSGGATTTFAWGDVRGLPVVLTDSADNKYLYGLGLISRTDSLNAKFYYHTDGLGSTTAVTDATGAVLNAYQYDVYGAVRAQTGTTPNEFTYTGQQTDSSGLQYLRARYYDAATGRFLSQDPLPFAQRYAYVGGNPVNLTDPSGMFPCPGFSKRLCHAASAINDLGVSASTKLDTTLNDITAKGEDVAHSVIQKTVRFFKSCQGKLLVGGVIVVGLAVVPVGLGAAVAGYGIAEVTAAESATLAFEGGHLAATGGVIAAGGGLVGAVGVAAISDACFGTSLRDMWRTSSAEAAGSGPGKE